MEHLKPKSRFQTIRILLFLLSISFAYATGSYAQSIVTGIVSDITGDPLSGVSVTIKGTTTGITTDVAGKYSINASPSSTLSFSFLGMTKQEIKVNDRRIIDITLLEDATNLDEVVVIGYGTQKKIHLTGSIAAVSNKEIMKTTASNITQALVGKLPGLITQQSTGTPGADDVSILIRGYSSFNDAGTVLVLVDGIERPMWRIDPNDVESVTILKDAASCAVYGIKGTNGVILVTTKRGSVGKPNISYKGSLTFSHLTALPKFMDGTQYMQYYNVARGLDGLTPYFTDEEIALTTNGDPTDGYENTNWLEPLYQTTIMHQHNLSVTGGNDNAKYYISGGFLRQNGFIEGHKMERGNVRSNIDIKATKDIAVSLNLAARVDDAYQPGGDSYANQAYNNVVGVLQYAAPFVPLEYNGYPTSGYRGGSNPLYAANNSGFDKSKTMKIETLAKLEYSAPFLKGLKASMSASWDWQDQDSKKFAYAYKVMRYDHQSKSYKLENCQNLLEKGSMFIGDTKQQQIVLRPSIFYSNVFGVHNVGALLLYEQTRFTSNLLTAARTDFPLFDLPDLNFGNTINTSSGNSGSSDESAYAGYIGRFNYAYDNKYLAEVSFRYDGSYNFHKDHRWGFFPSLSLSWVASEENFFKEMFPKIDRLKLRGSIGLVGSDNVGKYLYLKAYQWQNNNVAFGSTPTAQNTLYNSVSYPWEDLTWQKSRTINGGFELTAWNGLLGVEFDAFYKYTYDILQTTSAAYPPSLGGHFPTMENSGTVDSKGIELVLKHTNRIGKATYNLNGNLSYAKNRILSKIESDNILPWQSVLGTSVGSIWGLKSNGLFQTQEELDNAPAPIESTPRLGDIRYVDINGDGKITQDDFVKIGRNTRPEMMFAFMADAALNGFDLSIQLQGAALCDRFLQGRWNNGATDMTPLSRPWYGNWDNAPLYLVENSWRPDNTNAEYPRLSTTYTNNNAQLSDLWKRDGAYLRLKNVVIGYTFPKKWINKSGFSNLRIYASGNNLLTLTEFKYLDPEAGSVIQGYYPQQRTLSFGIDISF
ncbi:TonB-dependent receptor SusC [termite gut metagenome]|uniref:TonB-dependent receptor SusC n=1 Tax=termite gut metagenome TaxID=433724 RepID=A0A5J4T1M3_9ZZZZ